MDNEFISWCPPQSMMTDLKWWLCTLDNPSFYHELLPWSPCQDMDIFVDASTTWGIEIMIAGKWRAFKLHEDWKVEGQDICWLEMVTVEVLIYLLEAIGIANTTLLIHSDNQGTIGSISKGHSHNFHINLSICQAYVVLASQFIAPELVYISSKNNPVDPISHRELGSLESQNTISFSLPDKLQHILLDVS